MCEHLINEECYNGDNILIRYTIKVVYFKCKKVTQNLRSSFKNTDNKS